MLNGGGTGGGLGVHVGYLVCGSTRFSCHGEQMNPLSVADWGSFFQYCWLNEGLFIPLLLAAYVFGTRRDRRFIAATGLVFCVGSLFHVGLDVGGRTTRCSTCGRT